MKVITLSLCTLTGVVDVQEDGIVTVELTSPVSEVGPETVTLTKDQLPPKASEGDTVNLTVLVEDSLVKYCHNQL